MKNSLYGLAATVLVAISTGCASTCCGPMNGPMFDAGCQGSFGCSAVDTMFGGCTDRGCTASSSACGGCDGAPIVNSARGLMGAGGLTGAGGPTVVGVTDGWAAGTVGGGLIGSGLPLQPVRRIVHLPQSLQNACANGTRGQVMGPTQGMVQYPYYTTRGPRDFFLANPSSIGP